MLGSLGLGVFSTILKLSIRLRSFAAIHLALNSHLNVVWRSQRHVIMLCCKDHSGFRGVFVMLKVSCQSEAFPIVVLMVFSPWNVH